MSLQLSPIQRAVRLARSASAMIVFFLFLIFVVGLPQRLVVFPLIWILPQRRTRIMGAWIRIQARLTRAIVVHIAGVRMRVSGAQITECAVVVMNHQSVLDIVVALCAVDWPAALIPVRTRYERGIPGISPFLRAARYPFIGQRRSTAERDIAAIDEAADRVASGEASLVFFPEGHRTRDGEISRFMPRGLTLTLTKAPRPVYCIVGDGMWRVRTLADAVFRLSGTVARARITGPFAPPARTEDIPQFIDSLRDRMVATLHEMRADEEAAARRQGRHAD